MTIRLPIDIKSLYFNIKNDNESGHTATVATPLKQYGSVNQELAKIRNIPENINRFSKEELIGQLQSKSRAEAKIDGIFVFDKIAVNGILVDNIPSFCMYIREETAEGYVHKGRQKVHYPPSLNYSDEDIEIDNKAVMRAISGILHDYAFIVEAFEYDTETKILNFDVILVGSNGIPYSKVFINRKGTGVKFTTVFSEEADSYDSEIIALRERLGYDKVGPDNFSFIMRENRGIAYSLVADLLHGENYQGIRNLTEEYPYALYDFEYKKSGIKHYVIVRFTSTKLKYFNLPMNKIQFCNYFSDKTTVCLITDINGVPRIHSYDISDLNKMSKSINSICYENTEE